MKILILSKDAQLTEQIKKRVYSLETKFQNKCQIVKLQEAENESTTAKQIIEGHYDIVLTDKSCTQSVWKISDICRSSNTSPKFYIEKDLTKLLSDEFANSNFSGAYRIDLKGETLAKSAVGPNNDTSLKFNIASTGKMLTAVGIMQLVEKGILDLKQPIINSLAKIKENYPAGSPEFIRIERYQNEYKDHLQFTPDELLTHTSGLDDQIGRIYEEHHGPQMLKYKNAEDFVKNSAPISEQKLSSKGNHRYSNLGFFILGLSIEACTGQNYYQYISENILKPWGMNHTEPVRSDGKTFAIPQFKINPPLEEPDWLKASVNNVKDQKILDAINIAKKALDFANLQYVDINNRVKKFENSLRDVTPEQYAQFKQEFTLETEEAFKSAGKYKQMLGEIGNVGFPLRDTVRGMDKNDPNYDFLSKLDIFIESLYFNIMSQGGAIKGFINDLSIAHPAGCWRSTVDDLMSFDKHLKDSGYLAKLTENTVVCDPTHPENKDRYGYGCVVNGGRIGHNGDTIAAHSTYFSYPEKGFSVVTLTNNDDNGHAMAEQVERKLILGDKNNIQYFDPRINTTSENSLISDIEHQLSIENVMKKTNILGISTSYLDSSGVISNQQVGVSDSSSHNVTSETLFGVASLSKPVFTYLVLKLAQYGKIDLDQPLQKTLPFNQFCKENGFLWHENQSSLKRLTSLTARMALSHTTGLTLDGNESEFKAEPGTEYIYSNVGLYYLQKLIEKKTNSNLEDLAKKYIFNPLQMKHSTFYRDYDLKPMSNEIPKPQEIHLRRYKRGLEYKVLGLDGYMKTKKIKWSSLPLNFPRDVNEIVKKKEQWVKPLLSYMAKEGHTTLASPVAVNSLYTTPTDYAILINAWMNDQSKVLQQAFQPVLSMTKDKWAKGVGVPNEDLEHVAWGLGLGLQLDEQGRATKAYHSGDMNNWRSWVAMDLEKKTAVVYFANSENGHILAEKMISPHVELNHVFSYFFTKYGFARKIEKNWKALEKSARDKIDKYFSDSEIITDLSMAESTFGRESNTAKNLKAKGLTTEKNIHKKSAIEIMVLNPDPTVHHNNKSVHENLWIKERFGKDNYLSIGVMLKKDSSELQFYFFEDCDKKPHPKFYSSLQELQKDLPLKKKDIFDRTHKVYLMGHGDIDSKYGFGNYHAHDDFSHLPDDTEQIYDKNFDKLINDILRNIRSRDGVIGITLEQCHADNLVTAKEKGKTHEEYGYPQSFLERLSAKYPHVTFSGTGPWSASENLQESIATDARASGGYPVLNAPITSMGGGIWKHGNTVIFHYHKNQIAVRKSPFASTETAKSVKINTVNYAYEILNQQKSFTKEERKEIIARICANRKILKIDDLAREPAFTHQVRSANEETKQFTERENGLLKQEQNRYLNRVQTILSQETYSDRDVLMVALGLNHPFIFDGRDDILQEVLKKENLLKLVMVSCGKVLLGDQNNNKVIDLLVKRGVSINSVDDKGRTALHYAVNNFYDYRSEPLNLVKKLLDCDANIKAPDKNGRTPLILAEEQSEKSIVIAGSDLHNFLQQHTLDSELVESAFGQASHTAKKIQSSTARLMMSLPISRQSHKNIGIKVIDDPLIEDAIQKLNIPAISISTTSKDAGIQVTHAGVTNKNNPQPILNNTPFEAASLSKPVFAYIILRMMKRGELPENFLDNPLHKICRFGPTGMGQEENHQDHEKYKSLTPRLLLSHQAGLPNLFNKNYRYVNGVKEGFDYSGEAYRFLNEVLENITGKTLNELAKKEFKELKMHDSSFLPVANESRAIGHDANGKIDDRKHHLIDRADPAASLFTTASDYAKFLKACVNDEFVRKHMFKAEVNLNGKDKKAMEAGVSSDVLQHLSWGLGIGLCKREDGSTVAFHWGDAETCRNFAAINLDTEEVVTCFTNSANGPRIFQQVAEPVVGDIGVISKWLTRREGLQMTNEQLISQQVQQSASSDVSHHLPTPLKNPLGTRLERK